MVKISVCFGTMNRRPYLEKAIESARRAVGPLTYEIIVACGPSADGSLTYLLGEREAKGDLVVIEQTERTGAVAAFNACFTRAQGEYVAAFNDDAEYSSNELERAAKILDEREEVGQVAIPFSLPDEPAHIDFINLWGVRLPYANFSVIRRELGNKLGWWGTHYQYAGDTELSVLVWNSNFRVVPLIAGHIVHHQLKDDTRVPNIESKSLSAWNTRPVPQVVKNIRRTQVGLPTSKNVVRHAARPERPPKPSPRIVTPKQRLGKSARHKLAGVDGMTLVRYVGERGLAVKGLVSGTEYKFSGGQCLYVDNRDLDSVFHAAKPGDSLKVV